MDYDLLTRYVSGTCTPLERAQVDQWLGDVPDRADLVHALHEVATDTRDVSAERKAAMLIAVKRPSAGTPAESPAVARRERRSFTLPRVAHSIAVRVAAVVVLLGAAAAGYQAIRSNRTAFPLSVTTGLRSFATAPGQRLTFRLPDGTAVTLAPASVLRLPPDYGTRKRTVALEGEAVFTVTHDAERPFVVQTPHGMAHDLGTRFSVRAYPDDPAADVAVAEGLVAVVPKASIASQGDSAVLAPGERARITRGEQLTVDRDVPLDPYFAWTTGHLVFRDTPLREAATRLSRWYDIDVRIASPSVGDRLLTAALDEGTTVDVLPLIAASLNLELTQSGRVYTLNAK